MSEQNLYSALVNDSGVSALVSTKIYPVKAPQNTAFPYVVYRRITGLSVNGLDGEMGTTNGRFQIDVYSSTYTQVKALAEAVKEAVKASNLRSVLIFDQDFDFDDDSNNYRVLLEFRIWFTE